MATIAARPPVDRPKRKKESRPDIWSNLLRATAAAQARSRTSAIQHRELIICGGSPDDQRQFLTSLARPPPTQPPSRNQDRRQQKPKGELRLSNRYAYGYGHVTLFSPPPQSGTGVQVLGAEAEEVARVEVHTVPDAEEGYVGTLRGLLARKEAAGEEVDGEGLLEKHEGEEEGVGRRRPGVCILLSWKKPWHFLDQIKRWVQLLAKALLPDGVEATDPMDVLKDAQIAVTVVVQHTETQEDLFKESYKEEDFDWISQCLRTVLLPLSPLSAMVYTSSTAPPQQPGNPLTEPQKVIFQSLGLDLGVLSPKLPRPSSSSDTTTSTSKKDTNPLLPQPEFMDRMAIVIPAEWDNSAFIRILSENFVVEDLLRDWLLDLQPPAPPAAASTHEEESAAPGEVFQSSYPGDDDEESPELTPAQPSAIRTYEARVIDPQSHRRLHLASTAAPEITTKPDQKFLAEMRAHLQELESSDASRERPSGVSTTSLSSGRSGAGSGLPQGQATGALGELGEVSFNVGGVSYDSVSAEMAIERLRRPQRGEGTPKNKGLRVGTEKDKESATPGAEVKSPELPIDKLEEYFASLVAKSGGSREGTPSRAKE